MGRSLIYRLLIPSLALAILFGGAYSYFWTTHLSNETNAAFVATGQKAAQSIAVPVATGLWEFDENAVQGDLAALQQWDGFVFAQVIDQTGTFATYPADAVKPADWDAFVALSRDGASYQAFGEQYAFAAPLIHAPHGTIGHVIAVFSRDALAAKLTQINADAAIYAFGAISIFAVVLSMVAISVTRPVTRVTQQIERAAAGDLDIRPTDSNRADEVGRLARAVKVFSDSAVELVSIRAQAEAAETVARMAMIDPLTDLLNRRGLDRAFETLTTPDHDAMIAFISIDLDDFKKVNDMHGHGVGDAVLRDVAGRLRRCFPDAFAIARIGGDEFFILHPVQSTSAAMSLARGAVTEIMKPITVDILQCSIGASAGIDVQPTDTLRAEQGVLNSDQALNQAKRSGKGGASLYESSLGAQIRQRNDMAEQIRTALENDEFIPFFQPQVDSATLEVNGAEVLARWQRSDGTILPPGAFLDIADELSLTARIDTAVAEKAIATFDDWARSGISVPPLSINVSGKRLLEPALIKMLKDAARSGLSVNIELVEAIFLDDADDKTLLVLDQIRELGVGIEIDDFGTGHASIAGLMRVGPDTIKIDRQFIESIVHEAQPRQLLKVFIDLAKTFNMEVVAEGVESLDHVPILRTLGVGRLQGYAFSKPLSAHDLMRYLTDAAVSQRTVAPLHAYAR